MSCQARLARRMTHFKDLPLVGHVNPVSQFVNTHLLLIVTPSDISIPRQNPQTCQQA